MPATLTVTVSDAAFARLQQRAAAGNTTPEAVAAADLEPPAPVPGGFLAGWIGSIRSDVPDWGSRHDELIGQTLHEERRDHPPE